MNRWLSFAASAAAGYRAYRRLTDPGIGWYRGKAAVVTGASRGLGLVLARQLADAGARLAVCGRDPDELGRAYDDLAARGGRVVAVECDVTDEARVKEFLAVARRALGPVDVLVNNAGVIGVGPLEEQTLDDYDRSLRTHLWGPLYACREVIPEMTARRAGRIVNVASVGGRVAVPHLVPYSVGKFALVGLSDGLRVELARFGVSVTTACPGLIRTGSHLHAEFKGRHEDEYAWFALGNGLPGMSLSAEATARQILTAAARGDAEVVTTLPAKLAVAARALAPTLTADVLALVNRAVLPGPGGVGPRRVPGAASRGKLPAAFTALTDRAASANNETM